MNDTPTLTTLSADALTFHVDRQTRLGFQTPTGQKWLYTVSGFQAVSNFPEGVAVHDINIDGMVAIHFRGPDQPLSARFVMTRNGPAMCVRQLDHRNFGLTFQQRVVSWTLRCFDHAVKDDREERCHRFFEEATELVHAGGYTREQAHAMIDYVFDRPVGDVENEVGGTGATLAALCESYGLDMITALADELPRIEHKLQAIHTKWLDKPTHIKGPSQRES